jgi:hypothetical protein
MSFFCRKERRANNYFDPVAVVGWVGVTDSRRVK